MTTSEKSRATAESHPSTGTPTKEGTQMSNNETLTPGTAAGTSPATLPGLQVLGTWLADTSTFRPVQPEVNP